MNFTTKILVSFPIQANQKQTCCAGWFRGTSYFAYQVSLLLYFPTVDSIDDTAVAFAIMSIFYILPYILMVSSRLKQVLIHCWPDEIEHSETSVIIYLSNVIAKLLDTTKSITREKVGQKLMTLFGLESVSAVGVFYEH